MINTSRNNMQISDSPYDNARLLACILTFNLELKSLDLV
jgi:hypothetical protein